MGAGLVGCCAGGKAASIFPPVPAGLFRQRVIIEEPDITADTIGGYTGGEWMGATGWTTVATVWAAIHTINPTAFADQKQFRDKQYLTQQWFNVMLRYRGGIGTNMRLNWNNRYLSIFSVVNTDELNWQTVLYCREGG